jgi:ribosomal protein L44E
MACGWCGLYLVSEVQKLPRQKSQVQDQGKQRRKRLPSQPRPQQPPHKPTRMKKPGKRWSTKTTVFNDTLRVHFVKQS